MAECSDLLHCCMYFTANSLSRVITRMAEEEFQRTGLSPSHAFLLMLTNRIEGANQKELGEQLNLAPSTVTRFIDQLERRGLVKRESHGKRTHVFSTKKGMALQPEIEASWKSLYDRYSKVLGEEAGDELTSDIARAAKLLSESD